MSEPVLRFETTDDDWRLALHHYRAEGERRRHAVVCCHGLGSNHLAYDPTPKASLARHLAARGYDVLAVELRGHGSSDRPSRASGRGFGWSFDDYLLRDLPVLIGHAAQLSGRRAVHFIGHSMGGLLLYAHLAVGGSTSIKSGIAVASSLDYSGSASGFHRLMALRGVARLVPAVPVGLLARMMAPLVGRVTTPFERFNVWPGNTEPAVWRRISANGFHAVSTPVLLQLGTAMMAHGLSSLDGSRYVPRLREARAPVMSLAADRDAQCPPEAARLTLEALGSTRREHRVFGKAHGHFEHYGHFDLLVGRRAAEEVWPHVDAWLDEHD